MAINESMPLNNASFSWFHLVLHGSNKNEDNMINISTDAATENFEASNKKVNASK